MFSSRRIYIFISRKLFQSPYSNLKRIESESIFDTAFQLIKSFCKHSCMVSQKTFSPLQHFILRRRDFYEWRSFSYISTQETNEKLVKVKFSGMKPISTFHSEMEMKMGKFLLFSQLFFVFLCNLT